MQRKLPVDIRAPVKLNWKGQTLYGTPASWGLSSLIPNTQLGSRALFRITRLPRSPCRQQNVTVKGPFPGGGR